MRTATIEQFWNSQDDRIARKTPRCVVTLTERNTTKTWELDLENTAHYDVERHLAYGKGYTCLWNGTEPFADGRPFEITYTTTRKSSIDLLVNVGEPISVQIVPAKTGDEEWCRQMSSRMRTEVLYSLNEKPMGPNQLACHVWSRLDEAPGLNPFKTSEYIPIRATLKRLLEDGSVVRLRRGVYALSQDSQYDLFREAALKLCATASF
jgi:hypothetical protein